MTADIQRYMFTLRWKSRLLIGFLQCCIGHNLCIEAVGKAFRRARVVIALRNMLCNHPIDNMWIDDGTVSRQAHDMGRHIPLCAVIIPPQDIIQTAAIDIIACCLNRLCKLVITRIYARGEHKPRNLAALLQPFQFTQNHCTSHERPQNFSRQAAGRCPRLQNSKNHGCLFFIIKTYHDGLYDQSPTMTLKNI